MKKAGKKKRPVKGKREETSSFDSTAKT